jgi:hypothetical protein
MPNPLNTIASIGAINMPVPTTLIVDKEPVFRDREKKIPLQNGDRWFNPETVEEHIYYQGQWILLSK